MHTVQMCRDVLSSLRLTTNGLCYSRSASAIRQPSREKRRWLLLPPPLPARRTVPLLLYLDIPPANHHSSLPLLLPGLRMLTHGQGDVHRLKEEQQEHPQAGGNTHEALQLQMQQLQCQLEAVEQERDKAKQQLIRCAILEDNCHVRLA